MAGASYQQYSDPRNGVSVHPMFTGKFVNAREILLEDGYAPAKFTSALMLSAPEIGSSHVTAAVLNCRCPGVCAVTSAPGRLVGTLTSDLSAG